MKESVRIVLGLVLLATTACGGALAAGHNVGLSNSPAILPTASPAPKGLGPPSFPPCSPVVAPTPGIDNRDVQVGPDSWENFVTSDQWMGPKDGSSVHWYHVWAGTTGEAVVPPHVPAVWVDLITVSPDRCTINPTTVGDFTNAGARGALSITSVQGSWVSLRATDGQRFYFDLATDHFSMSAPASMPA